jgi:hypothetical protein
MKKQAVCEYCGQIFEEVLNNEGFASHYKTECVRHEITHLNLDEKFKDNLQKALDWLDNKYNSESTIVNFNISACWDSYYGHDITYDFGISNTALNNTVGSKMVVQYCDKEKVPTSEELIEKLEHHFFIPTINKKYEGYFRYEGFDGGDGAEDYLIGEAYMDDIFKGFQGKKVRLEVIE